MAFEVLRSTKDSFFGFLSVKVPPVGGVFIDRLLLCENTALRRLFFKETPPIGGIFTDNI